MRSANNHEPATARIAVQRRRAQREAPPRAAARIPPNAPPSGRSQPMTGRRRSDRQRRLGTQLWTLLHAQALLDDPACRRP